MTGIETEVLDETALQQAISDLLDEAGVTNQRKLISQIIETGVGLGLDATSRLNLKISAAAIEEMRRAFRIFAPHHDTPKVTIFGSARTLSDDPLSAQAESVARGLAEKGWMVVTGAGPGIMEAGVRGAGLQRSLGVSIRLPFEEQPNEMIAHDNNVVAMKYFFTRKLMLVKESLGFICLPGGFGTMDEAFELLTLQQTGKMEPMPIVLLDRPEGTFWAGFERFAREELAGSGMISDDDLDRVLITDSVEAAVAEIEGFWRNYDSLRWFGDRLVLRLREAPTAEQLAEINERFGGLLASGSIEAIEPAPVEVKEGDRVELPRVVLTPRRQAVGRLHQIIRAFNALV